MKYVLLLAGLAADSGLAASIDATYQSLLWKYHKGNFWAPLGLDATAYQLESPAGTAPEALGKRYADGCQSKFLPCTVLTVKGELTGPTLESQLQAYRALNDDVWSDAQVRLAYTQEGLCLQCSVRRMSLYTSHGRICDS